MNCLNIALLMDERDSSRLTAAERRAVEAHLNGCAECRAAFGAHEAMRGMAVPAMSPGFAERSRRLVVTESPGRARRAGGRPFVVVGLLVAGIAAAVVGLKFVGESGADADLAADAVVAPEPLPVAGESSDALPIDTDAAVTPTDAAADAAAIARGFTVAVSFRQRAEHPEAIRVSESVYRALLEALVRIPDLELIEIEETGPELAASWEPAFGVTTIEGVAEVQNTQAAFGQAVQFAPSGVIEIDRATDGSEFSVISAERLTVSEGLAVAEGGQAVFIVDTGVPAATGPGSEGSAAAAIPTALVKRMETVTGGTSASIGDEQMAGVVNVIRANNLEGVRVDFSTATAVSATPDESQPYDYVLRVTSSNAVASDSWNFSVMARSRSGNSFSASFGNLIGEPVAPAELLEPLIASLQDQLFPVDGTTLAAIEQRVIDTSLPLEDRLRELGRLTRMQERSGNATLGDEVALAVVDMAARVTDERQRLSLWRMLNGVRNAVLVQPLSNALRNDANETLRIEVALVLANFQRDPVARDALEAAANADPSPLVRQNARWAALDELGRRDLIVASLLDTRLSDAERIAPLLFDLSWARIEPVELDLAIDATVANELVALLRRQEQATTRARVLSRLDRERSPALAPLFVERLAEDEGEIVRTTAANALGRRLDEPGVRSALERAAASDPSPIVRDMAARALANGD